MQVGRLSDQTSCGHAQTRKKVYFYTFNSSTIFSLGEPDQCITWKLWNEIRRMNLGVLFQVTL